MTQYKAKELRNNFSCTYGQIKSFVNNKNSVALVRQRAIPTERPPLVGEVTANFYDWRGVAWSAWHRFDYGRNGSAETAHNG
jgi:hypothetical protein